MRARHFLLTIHAGTQDRLPMEGEVLDMIMRANCDFYSAQEERGGETEREHVQLYLGFGRAVRRAAVEKAIMPWHAHFIRVDYPVKAYEYCLKDDTSTGAWRIKGPEPPACAGARTDLRRALEKVAKDGLRACHLDPELAPTAARYDSHLVRHVTRIYAGKAYMPLKVICFWGQSRTGKTRAVPDGAGRIKVDSDGRMWFDDCVDAEIVYLDDFYGQIKASDFLQLTDNYRYPMRVFGGLYPRRFHTLYITSNVPPDMWYQNVPDEVKVAIQNRISETKEFTHAEVPTE